MVKLLIVSKTNNTHITLKTNWQLNIQFAFNLNARYKVNEAIHD